MSTIRVQTWNDCINVCTDDAKEMTGKIVGVVKRMKSEAPDWTSSHYIPHRHRHKPHEINNNTSY